MPSTHLTRRIRESALPVAIALLTVATARPLVAQETERPRTRLAERPAILRTGTLVALRSAPPVCALSNPASDPELSRELERRAHVLLASRRTTSWGKAAGLLVRAVEAAPACAPGSASLLRLAGRLYHAVGEPGPALAALEKAARHALARGELNEAVHILVDAAQVSVEMGRVHRAREIVERVELLSLSPVLTPGERETVLARIEPAARRTALRAR